MSLSDFIGNVLGGVANKLIVDPLYWAATRAAPSVGKTLIAKPAEKVVKHVGQKIAADVGRGVGSLYGPIGSAVGFGVSKPVELTRGLLKTGSKSIQELVPSLGPSARSAYKTVKPVLKSIESYGHELGRNIQKFGESSTQVYLRSIGLSPKEAGAFKLNIAPMPKKGTFGTVSTSGRTKLLTRAIRDITPELKKMILPGQVPSKKPTPSGKTPTTTSNIPTAKEKISIQSIETKQKQVEQALKVNAKNLIKIRSEIKKPIATSRVPNPTETIKLKEKPSPIYPGHTDPDVQQMVAALMDLRSTEKIIAELKKPSAEPKKPYTGIFPAPTVTKKPYKSVMEIK